ncbi:YCII-related domain-containing protein [Pseudarcicella hirudinis]|uniref:YCII-related domain-containing protein n=1 Tax=Pseudarcicella hirudinis TaxID=1079859 RepID=A0A1I5MFB0_9BACT|nr:YciI family protein [Pseudarcicella hirudinis]SFP08220.1 YCII-related domain-containing protein [Pseudarcicella hirudinis]
MTKKHFCLKLIPARPTFAQDMTEAEREIMQKHVVYWKELMDQGLVIVFGPVSDPAGTYGLGIVEVENEELLKSMTENDPASSINHYEIYPMRAITPQK